MSEIETLIQAAIDSEGKLADANKFYAAFLRTFFYIPIQKLDAIQQQQIESLGEPFIPLFGQVDDKPFMLIFDDLNHLKKWAEIEDAPYGILLGRDIIKGIAPNVYISLNLGSNFYKELAPDEIKRLKIVVSKTSAINS